MYSDHPIYQLLCNNLPQKHRSLKWYCHSFVFCCESVVWVGLSLDGLALFHLASTKAVVLDRRTHILNGPFTRLIVWGCCWLAWFLFHVGLSEWWPDSQTESSKRTGRSAWQSVTSIVLHGTRQSQRPTWRRGMDFTSYRGEWHGSRNTCRIGEIVTDSLKKKRKEKTNTVF